MSSKSNPTRSSAVAAVGRLRRRLRAVALQRAALEARWLELQDLLANALFREQSIELYFECFQFLRNNSRVIHHNIPCLSNPVCTISGLVFFGWIPASGEVHNVVCRLHVHAKTNRCRRQNDDAKS